MISYLFSALAFASPIVLELGVEQRSVSHPFLNISYKLPTSSLRLHSDQFSWSKYSIKDEQSTWFAVHGQGFQTLQTHQIFENGDIDPSQSFQSSYVGFNIGQLRTNSNNLQFGGRINPSYYWFSNFGENIEEMEPQVRTSISSLFLWSYQGFKLYSYLGSTVVFTNELEQYPSAYLHWEYEGITNLSPIAGMDLGTAKEPDMLSLSRIGGERSGFIPLMGADWAEFLVKDVVIGRLGVKYKGSIQNFGHRTAIRADVAWLQDWKLGLGLENRLSWKEWSVNSHLGYGLWKETALPSFSVSLGWNLLDY